jgi:hypothetical protein
VPVIANIDTALEIDDSAVPLLHALVAKSTHANPMLSIAWQGEGPSSESLAWRWIVKTVDRALMDYIDYIAFEKRGFSFYCTHEQLERLPMLLDVMRIRRDKNSLAITAREGCELGE